MKTSKDHSTQAAPKAGSQPAAAQPTLAPALARQLGNAGLQRILQAKLAVGDPQDHFEQEADRIADHVMRMPDVGPGRGVAPAATPMTVVQRAADATSALPVVDAALEGAVAALDGRGGPLSPEVRSFMEPRFGADLSAVRIHTDAHAHDLARSVNARAFTVGRNVVFGAGYYSPQIDSGRRLIAHELTHTLQQGATLRRSPGTSVTQPYPTIKRLGPYTYSTQEVTDGKTAQWRIWNWARTEGKGNAIDRGPQHFLEQLVAQARDAGHDMLVLTIENISADSVQRLSKPGSPMARHLGATAVERIDDTTIRMVIPLGGKPESGATDSGPGSRRAGSSPKASPTETTHAAPLDSPETETVVGGIGREPSQRPVQPKDPVVVGGPGRDPRRTPEAPRDPVVVGGFGRGATRPVDVPETLPDNDGVPIPVTGSEDTTGVRTNPVPRPTSPGTTLPDEAVPEHIDDGPNIHRPPTQSFDGSTQSLSPRPPASTTPGSSGGSGSTPTGSTVGTGSSTPSGTTNEVGSRPPAPDSQASTNPQERPTRVQRGAPTQVDPAGLFRAGGNDAAGRLAPVVERVSMDQWVHPIQQVGEGINTKYLLVDAVTGERWLFKPASGEEVMGFGPELGIQTGERWRRALAAAHLAQDLGLNTPYVRLVELVHSPTGPPERPEERMEGMVGSLQEWRQGYEARRRRPNQAQADFDRFWNSRFRHDIDAFDYFIANQDRHQGNVMIRMEGDRPSTMLIDQDAAIPPSPARFSTRESRDRLEAWQRDLPPSVSSELAGRFRELAERFPDAELRRWLTDAEVDGLWSRLNEVIDGLNSGRIGIIEESPTRAAETAGARRTNRNGAGGTFSTSGTTEDVSPAGTTKVRGTKTRRTGSPSPTPTRSRGSATPTVTGTGPAPDSGAPGSPRPTGTFRTPASGEASLPKAAATVAPGPQPLAGPRSNVQVTAAEAINIDVDVEHQTGPGPRRTGAGASASGQAITVDVRTGGPGRQTTGGLTVTGQDVGVEVGSAKPGKGGPTAGIRLDSQGNRTFDVGWAFQTKGGSSIKPTFSHGTRVDALEPIELEDGRFLVAFTMTETTSVGVGGAARRAPQGGPGFSAGGNVSAFEAESKQGTRIFKTKPEAEAFRSTAALQLTFDRTNAVPATSDDAKKIPIGETRGQSGTEGRNVGVSASFSGATLGRNWQTSDTTGLSFYRQSEDLLNVTASVTVDKAKDWGIGALVLANQKGGDTTQGFSVTIQFNLSTQAGSEALDLYLKTRVLQPTGARIVGVMELTGDGSYDRYQMPGLGTAAWRDRGWHKETRDETGVTKEFGGEQVHEQDPTWLAELTGDRELYSSAQLISQQIHGKEKYTAIINIKSESGEYNREQLGKIFMGAKTPGPAEQSGTWTLSAEIDKKVVHELEQASSKFKGAKNPDDKQRILSDVFRNAGAGMAGGLVRSGGRFMLAWDLELKGDPNFPGPAGRDRLAMQREALAGKLKTSPEAAAQVVREAQDVINRLAVRRKAVEDQHNYTDLPQELREQQLALIDRHVYEFNQVRSNALMTAGKRDPKESIEAIRARIKTPNGYDDLKPEQREIALLQDKVADHDAAINEIRRQIEIGLEAVRKARVRDDIPKLYRKHYMPSRIALREADAFNKRQSELGPRAQELRARAFNAAAPQARTEAWRQLEAAVSSRYTFLTLELDKIKEAGAELVPITQPESRWGARYDEFWAPIEDLADEEPEEEFVPAPLSMTLEEPRKAKRRRRR